jgi:hypothetical protein
MAGDTWHGPLDPDTARADDSLSGPTVFASGATSSQTAHHKPRVLAYDDLQTARLALQAGEQNRAVDILSRAALGTGPAAENAAYELGRITRDNLGHPRQALVLWDRYRTRFPTGLLRTETDLSMIETLARLGDTRAALTEAEAFVSRHPSSERRAEIQQLAERLRTSDVAPKRK